MEPGTLSGGATRAGGAPGGVGPDFDFGATLRGFAAGQVVFGRYRLERMLGRGGMGVVWLAEDGKLGRPAALKFLPEIVQADAVALDDLKRETNRSLDLTYRHIVRIYDFLEGGGVAAISMEYIDGRTLSALRLERPGRCFDVEELGPWLGQLCEALDYAHAVAKVVHRDLKPANLMVDASGALKVTDFGISSSLTESVSRMSVGRAGSGTLVYMSPQQALGGRASVSDDIYSLGATLYDLVTGKPPFYAGNIQHQVETVVPPSMRERRAEFGVEGKAEIPEAWEKMVAGCLEKDPAKRPGSAAEVAEGLGVPISDGEGRAGEVFDRIEAEGGKRDLKKGGGLKAEGGRRKAEFGKVLAAGVGVLMVCGASWWFGIEKPKRDAAAREAQVVRFLAEGEAAVKMQDFAKGRMAFVEIEKLAARDARAVAGLEKLDAAEREAVRLAAARGGVEITTDPPGAEVTVGGVAKGPSPLRQGDLRLGKYPLKIEMPGYEPIEREIEVVENQFANPGIVRLVRSIGTLQIATEPGGQRYQVALKAGEAAKSEMPVGVALSGTTPATLEGLPTGTYTVNLSRQGWPNYTGEARVERGKPGTINWTFTEGELALHTVPEGAQWEITCEAIGLRRSGVTPATERLPVGNYRISFKREGWPEHARDVVVGKSGTPEATWEFAEGSMGLSSDPAGAEYRIFFAGAPAGAKPVRIGLTPKDEPAMPAEDYEVVWQYRDWPEKRTRVAVAKGVKAVASAAYPYGALRVASSPPGAKIFVNEKPYGEAPVTIDRLPAGDTRVRAALDGYADAEGGAVVAAGGTGALLLELKIRPFPEGKWEQTVMRTTQTETTTGRIWLRIQNGVGYYGSKFTQVLKSGCCWPGFRIGDPKLFSPASYGAREEIRCNLKWVDDKIQFQALRPMSEVFFSTHMPKEKWRDNPYCSTKCWSDKFEVVDGDLKGDVERKFKKAD